MKRRCFREREVKRMKVTIEGNAEELRTFIKKEQCECKALLAEMKKLNQTCERLQEILLYVVSEQMRFELGQKQRIARDAMLAGVEKWIAHIEESSR